MTSFCKWILFFGLVPFFFACSTDNNTGKGHCKDENTCLNDPSCMCWCSVKCGYRKKTAEDSPVFVADDANGKHCYCKQWDLDHYKENCIEHKNIPENPSENPEEGE